MSSSGGLDKGGSRAAFRRYCLAALSRANRHFESLNRKAQEGGSRRSQGTARLRKERQHYFELLASLPQHSGRSGNSELFQPPPRAWTSVTASTMRRPRILTAVTSSERAAL